MTAGRGGAGGGLGHLEGSVVFVSKPDGSLMVCVRPGDKDDRLPNHVHMVGTGLNACFFVHWAPDKYLSWR